MKWINKICHGDCLETVKQFPDSSIDMIFISPPYANRRKSSYDGVEEKKYVEWFLPIANEFKRILKSTGSFFLNIKPHTHAGERVLYVFDLVLALKHKVGFLFIDEFIRIDNGYAKYDCNKDEFPDIF